MMGRIGPTIHHSSVIHLDVKFYANHHRPMPCFIGVSRAARCGQTIAK